MNMRPLNIFQRCIRVWEKTHPYNAAQILHVAGEADLARITAIWNDVLADSGLGTVRVQGRHFCYEPAPRQEVAVVSPELGLDGYITREINRPFGEPKRKPFIAMPFRPFIAPGNGAHHLGVVYQHWVADSVSMRMLLREWFCRLHDPRHAAGQPLHIPHGGFWRYFGPARARWNLLSGALAVISSMKQFKRVRRIETDPGAQDVACSLHRLPDGMIDDLLAVAHRRGVTLNDLFLSALARACDAHGVAPRRSSRDLALGTIVDLRAMSSEDLENTFSLFLGFTAVVVEGEHLADPDQVLTGIARQNSRHKESRAAAANMLRLAAGYAQVQFLSPQRLEAFYRNYMPLSGGVSNVNMNRAWPAQYHPAPLLDYIRVAPTGPMVPVVIAVTTIGSRFTFTLTRRASLVDHASGVLIAQSFIDELTARAKQG